MESKKEGGGGKRKKSKEGKKEKVKLSLERKSITVSPVFHCCREKKRE